jgi:hypothetical protein
VLAVTSEKGNSIGSLWDIMKARLRGKYILKNGYDKKERSQINHLSSHLKKIKKKKKIKLNRKVTQRRKQ